MGHIDSKEYKRLGSIKEAVKLGLYMCSMRSTNPKSQSLITLITNTNICVFLVAFWFL